MLLKSRRVTSTGPMYFVFCRLYPSFPSHQGSVWLLPVIPYTIKKEKKIVLIYNEIQNSEVIGWKAQSNELMVQSHIWLTASSYMSENLRISSYIRIGSPSSYMSLHPIPSEFPYIWGIFFKSFLSVYSWWVSYYSILSGFPPHHPYFPGDLWIFHLR